jgi:hypothetical protein
MLKNLIIIALLLVLIYLYYQKRNLNSTSSDYQALENKFTEVVKVNKIFAHFCQNEIGGKDIEEIRSKLNGRTLTEILTENEDYELEVDTLRRSKNELEADLLAQSNGFKSLLKEKESLIKRLEKDLTNLHNLSKIQSQKVSDLEAEVKKLSTTYQSQLKALNGLFDPQAYHYDYIDFEGLMSALKQRLK